MCETSVRSVIPRRRDQLTYRRVYKMKFLISTWGLIVLACFVFGVIEVLSEHREKRSLYQEMCPQNMTEEECKTMIEAKSKAEKSCHRYFLRGHHVEWQLCGRATCGENTRLVEEDLSKPYPECCQTCEVIDPSKPASWSATGK